MATTRSLSLLLFVSCSSAALVAPCAAQTWTGVTPVGGGPAARSSGAATFDSLTGEMLVFGGLTCGNCYSSETWLYDGAARTWTRAFPTTAPTGTSDATMCYDELRNRAVLFGGYSGGSKNWTWEWDGVNRTWTQVTNGVAPPPRFRAALAYDLARGVVVLFGGMSGPPWTGLADTWEYNGFSGTWTRIMASSPPGRREAPQMAYDPVRGVMVMFGGGTTNTAAVNTTTWEYDGATGRWSQITTVTSPPTGTGRGHRMWYDPQCNKIMLYGGSTLAGGGGPTGGTWQYDGVDWTQVATGTPVSYHQVAYDSLRTTAISFGGWLGLARNAGIEEYTTMCCLPATYAVSSRGCPGSGGRLGTLISGSTPKIGRTCVVNVFFLPVGPSAMFLGFSSPPPPIDLAAIGMPSCFLSMSPEMDIPLTPNNGRSSWSVAIPNDPGWCGTRFYNQVFSIDPGANTLGVTSSNLGTATIGI